MMGQQAGNQDRLFYFFNLEAHVPVDHLLRGINQFLDLRELRRHLAPFYSHHTGRPSLAILEATRETSASTGEQIEIRVGMHTGPVFAGVVGETRFHYKLFGETVNVASRIQSQSAPERILVSETTLKRLRGKYKLQEHGSVPLKGHGPMGSAWLISRA